MKLLHRLNELTKIRKALFEKKCTHHKINMLNGTTDVWSFDIDGDFTRDKLALSASEAKKLADWIYTMLDSEE